MGALPPRSPGKSNPQIAFRVATAQGIRGARQQFSLGFPGEYWSKDMSCLVVPVGGPNNEVVLVSASSDYKKYTVITTKTWSDTDSALMAAALVHEVINGYHSR